MSLMKTCAVTSLAAAGAIGSAIGSGIGAARMKSNIVRKVKKSW